jgi:hypothetical protein
MRKMSPKKFYKIRTKLLLHQSINKSPKVFENQQIFDISLDVNYTQTNLIKPKNSTLP